MARIYKKKTKQGTRWGYRIYMGTDPATGKDIRKAKEGFLKEKDAKLAASVVERQLADDEYIQPSKMLFSDVSSDWERYYAQDAKESSQRARGIALKRILSELGDKPIQRISKKHYQDTIDTLAEKFSYNYMDSIHSTAHMVFAYAVETKLIKENPASGAKLPKKKVTVEELENESSIQDTFMEREELEEFLTVAKHEGLDGDLLTFTMLAYTGLRIGELLALKWSEVDTEKHTLRVIRTYYNPSNNKKNFQLLTPKTESSIRTITIDPVLVGLLHTHKQEQDTIASDNPFYNDQGFIFAGNEGYPKPIKHMAIRLQRLLQKTSIKKHITTHSFRHTHTSLLIEANAHIKEIQDRLGHSDINTTMDIYAHMTQSHKKEASTKFSNLMENLSNTLSD
ncbi:tyrosine-type recombinase/integrase [Salicibibacter kimchii]|uniref:Site-specific integrase n=1 Tax=Salicibibacter kimchii TaxID=2099786 RepID=A0A345C2H6_9BACI|nr:tyrosine-type recombinase/integrase [Salicibibacter kimchii]AXF57407.1 site-specific integrase [Salicibibacter kimchii]